MTNTPTTTFGGSEGPAALAIEHVPADPRRILDGSDPTPRGTRTRPATGNAEQAPTLTTLVRLSGLACIGLGVAVLAGWAFEIDRLKSVLPRLSPMKPPTAVGFGLIGLALLASGNARWLRVVRLAAAGAAALIAALVTIEFATGWDLPLDRLLFADALSSPHPGRMALSTATELLFLAVGLLALLVRRRLLAQGLGLVSLAGASLAGLGYLYGVRSLYSTGPYSTMALHTVVGIGVASVGLLAAIPNGLAARIARGSSPGSELLRRLLPVVVIGMPVIGWVRLEGQRDDLYNTAFGLSMMVVASIVVVIATSWRASVAVDRSVEQLRSARGELAEANAKLEARVLERTSELARSEERYRVLVEQMPAVVYVWDTGAHAGALYMSPQIVEMLGYPVQDWYTERWVEFVHPDDREAVLDAIDRAVTRGDPYVEEYRYLAADGRIVWVRDECQSLLSEPEDQRHLFQGVMVDITERKRAQAALEEAHQQLRAILEASPVAIFVVDLSGTVLSWNPGAERIFGWSADEAIGRVVPMVPEDRFAEFEASRDRLVADGWQPEMERVRRRKDGSLVDVNLSTGLLRDVDGSPAGIVAVMTDISERKQVERELERGREQLAEAQRIAKVGSFERDLDTREGLWSEEMYRIHGLEPGPGAPPVDAVVELVPQAERERYLRATERSVKTGAPLSIDYPIRTPSGDERILHREWQVENDSDGRPRRILGTVQDVTEWRRAEHAVREAEARYRTLVEQIPAMTFLDRVEPGATLTYTPIYVSPQVETMLGFTPEAWLARAMVWEERVHAEDRERVERAAAKALTEQMPIAQEYRMIAADGRELWVHEDSHPVGTDASGSVLWQGVMYDVTERKRTELILRESEAELQRSLEVLQRTDEERRQLLANLLAVEDQRRVRMAEGIEDRSLQDVTALSLRLESLRRRLDDPEQLGALDRMGETVNATIERLRQLLVELHPRVLEKDGLGPALREYLDAMGGEAGLDIVFHDRLVDEPDVEARIVAYRIAQEAVSNAMRHAHATCLDVEAESSMGGVRIRVSDDGGGFDPDRDEPGHRLGLASMRERAELAGGWFRLRSDPKAGTAVEFWVPTRSSS